MLGIRAHGQLLNAGLLHKKPEPTGFCKGKTREKQKTTGAREGLSTWKNLGPVELLRPW